MFISDKSKIFINAGINFLTLKTSSSNDYAVDYDGYVFDRLKLSSSQSFKSATFGIGFNYNNKYSIEARYNTSINMLEEKGPYADLKYTSNLHSILYKTDLGNSAYSYAFLRPFLFLFQYS